MLVYIRLVFLFCLVACTANATDRVLVEAKVNSQPLRFGLDTGAGIEVTIWRSIAEKLGLKFTAVSPELKPKPGEVGAGISDPVTLEFMGRLFPGSRIAVVDVPAFAIWEVQGLIGWPAINKNIWVFDLAQNNVVLADKVPDETVGWLKFPVQQDAKVLALQLPPDAPGGSAGVLTIDTGSPDGVHLAPRQWHEWKHTHSGPAATFDSYFMLGAGFVAKEVGWADHLTLAGLTLNEVTVEEASPSEIASWGTNYVGTLGIAALRKLVLIVDGHQGIAYINVRGGNGQAVSHNRLGAVFMPSTVQGSELIAHVAEGSPAAVAGIREGDILERINQLDVATWRTQPGVWPLNNFFTQPAGTTLDLLLKRGGKEFRVTAVLRDLLGPKGTAVGPAQKAARLPEFQFVPPFAVVARKARALGVPIDRFVGSDSPLGVQKGDKVTAVVSVVDHGVLQQWLVMLVANDLKPAEKRQRSSPLRVFTSTGHELQFERDRIGLAIRVVGPFKENSREKDVDDIWSGAIVAPQSLALGLDRTAIAVRKLFGGGISFRTGPQPFPEKEAALSRTRNEAAGFGIEDEKAFAGAGPALGEFYQIISQTPGVREILFRMLDIPWSSFLRHLRQNIEILPPVGEVSRELWGLPPGAACREFCIRIDLDGVPKLVCRLAVTHPSRPFQTDAGIVGLAAQKPDGSGPHVMVRLLAAHCAEEDASSKQPGQGQ
jgi:membrane-associated protease RseP (regulator of RpoE activity)